MINELPPVRKWLFRIAFDLPSVSCCSRFLCVDHRNFPIAGLAKASTREKASFVDRRYLKISRRATILYRKPDNLACQKFKSADKQSSRHDQTLFSSPELSVSGSTCRFSPSMALMISGSLLNKCSISPRCGSKNICFSLYSPSISFSDSSAKAGKRSARNPKRNNTASGFSCFLSTLLEVKALEQKHHFVSARGIASIKKIDPARQKHPDEKCQDSPAPHSPINVNFPLIWPLGNFIKFDMLSSVSTKQ